MPVPRTSPDRPTTVPGPPGAVVSSGRRRYAILLVLATLFVIFAGAEVKSHEAGLSVPGWPLSYGAVMPPMEGNIFFEHGHRLVAASVGLLTVVLAVWTARTEARPWVRALGWFALAAVVAQGVLGGLTVLLLLPPAVSIAHGTLAQIFLCLMAWLAYANSREGAGAAPQGVGGPGADPRRAAAAFSAARLALAAVFVQLLLGAWVRHSEAGLAVPFFPLSSAGSLLPAHVDRLVVIHMLHRGFAFVVALAVLRAALLASQARAALMNHAGLLAALIVVQGSLGASIVWTRREPTVTSLHVTCGAALLVLSWLLVLRLWRTVRVPAGLSAATVPEVA